MRIWPVSLAVVALVTLSAQPDDVADAAVGLWRPSCVPTAPMPIHRVAPESLEQMPVTKATVVPAMPTTLLVPCYQADSLAGAPRR